MAKNAFNTVTPLSKTVALIMFIAFPFIGFYLGMEYQKRLDKPFMRGSVIVPSPVISPGVSQSPNPDEGVMCTMDAKLCPDGSAVGRVGPNCEFAPCPGND